MPSVELIPIPLPHVGSVNAWLLRGDPLTLVDTGPRSDEALAALEQGLRKHGLRVEDIELVIGTHHHHDHVGLAATIKRRSGARVAVLAGAASYGASYAEHVDRDRLFARELMTGHGVPGELLARSDALWEYIAATAESFEADVLLADGDRIRAGDRDLRVLARPGHSGTDTLFVDDAARLAVVGDHVLANISPNTEIYRPSDPELPRSRSRLQYLDGLKQTARLPLVRLHTGHGPPVTAHRQLVREQLAQHRRRCARIIRILEHGPATAYTVAERLWSPAIVREQPLLVVWEALGHLDLLLATGVAAERVDGAGFWRYSLRRSAQLEAELPGGAPLAWAS